MEQPGRRVLLIVNPVSGGGRGARVLREAMPALREAGMNPEVSVTAAGHEPRELARKAADDGVDLVVAVGGDGHAAAVAEGLVGTRAALAVLPAGSANDYAQALRLPRRDVRAAVAAIVRGDTQRVDVIKVRLNDAEGSS